MKENRYDDPVFFEKYARMARSRKGLAGAGEWQTLKALLPDFAGRRVVDLGCGYGWHCAWAAEHGARSVLGVDVSARMLEVARERNAAPCIEYRRCAMEDLELPEGCADVVLSSLALHYVRDYEALMARIAKWLAPGGVLVFSVEHPVFTAQGPQDWVYREDGSIAHFPVDDYFIEGPRDAVFLGEHVVKYHRTLTTCLAAVTRAGLMLREVREPQPPEEMMSMEGMRDELRRPMMLIVRAEKPL